MPKVGGISVVPQTLTCSPTGTSLASDPFAASPTECSGSSRSGGSGCSSFLRCSNSIRDERRNWSSFSSGFFACQRQSMSYRVVVEAVQRVNRKKNSLLTYPFGLVRHTCRRRQFTRLVLLITPEHGAADRGWSYGKAWPLDSRRKVGDDEALATTSLNRGRADVVCTRRLLESRILTTLPIEVGYGAHIIVDTWNVIPRVAGGGLPLLARGPFR